MLETRPSIVRWLTLLMMLVLTSGAAAAGPDRSVIVAYTKAVEALDAGDYERARHYASRVHTCEAWAHHAEEIEAISWIRQDRPDRALDVLDVALERDLTPDWRDTLLMDRLDAQATQGQADVALRKAGPLVSQSAEERDPRFQLMAATWLLMSGQAPSPLQERALSMGDTELYVWDRARLAYYLLDGRARRALTDTQRDALLVMLDRVDGYGYAEWSYRGALSMATLYLRLGDREDPDDAHGHYDDAAVFLSRAQGHMDGGAFSRDWRRRLAREAHGVSDTVEASCTRMDEAFTGYDCAGLRVPLARIARRGR